MLQPTLPRQPLTLDEVILANAQLAALKAQRVSLLAAHDAAYERWLSSAGPKPSEGKLDDALEALRERIEDLEDALDATHEPTPFEAFLAAAEAEAREGRR